MSLPRLPDLPKSFSTSSLISSAQARLNSIGQHSPPAYLRETWAYTGRLRSKHYKVNPKADTQLWRPLMQENLSSRILNYRRKETLQDSLRSPARMNIAQLNKKKPYKHWMSAYNQLPNGKNLR